MYVIDFIFTVGTYITLQMWYCMRKLFETKFIQGKILLVNTNFATEKLGRFNLCIMNQYVGN